MLRTALGLEEHDDGVNRIDDRSVVIIILLPDQHSFHGFFKENDMLSHPASAIVLYIINVERNGIVRNTALPAVMYEEETLGIGVAENGNALFWTYSTGTCVIKMFTRSVVIGVLST